ncbi:hypothetical protein BN1423_1290013 [Carnobacterium maltaromaticum]|nr:hypothetical protein CM318V1_460006 [Carnobacterium maltaromaticum]CRH21002.1 hypothetical protein BN1423_1290013 [Carnobacterium maltaromaticum]
MLFYKKQTLLYHLDLVHLTYLNAIYTAVILAIKLFILTIPKKTVTPYNKVLLFKID